MFKKKKNEEYRLSSKSEIWYLKSLKINSVNSNLQYHSSQTNCFDTSYYTYLGYCHSLFNCIENRCMLSEFELTNKHIIYNCKLAFEFNNLWHMYTINVRYW